MADAGDFTRPAPVLLALVIREVDKATKGENGNENVKHRSIGFGHQALVLKVVGNKPTNSATIGIFVIVGIKQGVPILPAPVFNSRDRCHSGIGLLLIAEFVQVVINADARIFKVCPFYGLNVISLAQSLQDKQALPKGNEL